MNYKTLRTSLFMVGLGATGANAEQWLKTQVAEPVLGFRQSDSEFKTCNKIVINLKKIGDHKISDATVYCTSGGTINQQQEERERDLKKRLERPTDSVYIPVPAKKRLPKL